MSLLDLVDEKRPEILRIAAKHGARNLRLFGSVARGEDHEGSDVDLLAEISGLGEQVALKEDLQHLLGVNVDVMTSPHRYLRERILEEAIPLEHPQFRELAVIESGRPHVPLDRDHTYLQLMLDYVKDAVEMAAETSREAFLTERFAQRGLMLTVALIGEYAGKVSPELRAQHEQIPWTQIVALRNISVHDYPGLDLAHVWDETIHVDIPQLKTNLEKLL